MEEWNCIRGEGNRVFDFPVLPRIIRYLITTHGDLHIRDVSKNDENTQYKCQYRDNFIGRTFFSEEGNLIVTGTQYTRHKLLPN